MSTIYRWVAINSKGEEKDSDFLAGWYSKDNTTAKRKATKESGNWIYGKWKPEGLSVNRWVKEDEHGNRLILEKLSQEGVLRIVDQLLQGIDMNYDLTLYTEEELQAKNKIVRKVLYGLRLADETESERYADLTLCKDDIDKLLREFSSERYRRYSNSYDFFRDIQNVVRNAMDKLQKGVKGERSLDRLLEEYMSKEYGTDDRPFFVDLIAKSATEAVDEFIRNDDDAQNYIDDVIKHLKSLP